MEDQLTVSAGKAGRALVYRFLATLYLSPPETGWLGGLAGQGLFDEFPVPLGNPDMVRGAELLRDACARLAADPDGQEAEAVKTEYDRLFVGPFHLPAPPWESVYRSDERLVFDWPTLEVREQYRLMGLSVTNDREPDDHIGLELLFMALLCERAAAGEGQAESARRTFLEQHLLKWVPAFAADLVRGSVVDLYAGLAHLTVGLLALEQAD